MQRIPLVFLFLLSAHLFSQQADVVDFTTGKIAVEIDPYKKQVKGNVMYTFDVLKDTDSVFIDARQMVFSEVLLNDKSVDFYNDGAKLWLVHPFKAKTMHTVAITYSAIPEKAMYFIGWEYPGAKKQVWTQGQGKYTSNWLPSFDDVNEKIQFKLSISFYKDYEVISNGKLLASRTKDNLTIWNFGMQQPMSSYLLAIAIGKYRKKNIHSEKGTPLIMYYYPEDSLKVEPTYRYTSTMFRFFEKETGVAYPWQNYKQVPVKDFLYAGMENTSVTLFSDTYITDSIAFKDRNYINVNAHELAHQWFGNMVTAKSGTHHWLQEGFATYYALLAEREIFGDDHYYWKLYQSAEQLIALSGQNRGEAVMNAGASSLTFYEKGAWALHILREETGRRAFKKGIKNYLLKYRFKTAGTGDFIREMEQASGKDLSGFTALWLKQQQFPEAAALRSLRKNRFLKTLLSIKKNDGAMATTPRFSKENYYPLNWEILYKYKGKASEAAISLYREILRSDLVKERQALAIQLDTIPVPLKKDFELLLQDQSYITIENALYKLWMNFPEDQKQYLDKTRKRSGFNNKNIEMLWLTLAIITQDYEVRNKPEYYRRLSGYTTPVYGYEIRQNAFGYLYQLQLLSDKNLEDLIDACLHHTWQFASASRSLLETLLKDPEYRNRFRAILPQLDDKEQTFLDGKMKL